MSEMQHEKSNVEETLVRSESTSAAELSELRSTCEKAEENKQMLEQQLTDLESEHNNLLSELKNVRSEMSDRLYQMETERNEVEASLQHSKTDTEIQLTASQATCTTLGEEKQKLTSQVEQLEQGRLSLTAEMDTLRSELVTLKGSLQSAENARLSAEQARKKDLEDSRVKLLFSTVEECEEIIKDSLAQFENPHHATVTCTAEYLLSRTESVENALRLLESSYGAYSKDKNTVGVAVKSLCDFSHRLADLIIHGKATANAVSIEAGEALSHTCRMTGEESLALLQLVKNGSGSLSEQGKAVSALMKKLVAQAEELVPKVEDVKAEQMGNLIENEMEETTRAIEAAAARINAMLAESREAHSGIQLEVNERVLDSCTGLMKCIKILIERAKVLQKEIVGQGRGSTSAKEFYKRHHRWTEGLISAAKAVGWGANVLVEAADKLVKGEGKYEELMVCSQEIAASTTQLVVASKVKAGRRSENLGYLSEASKSVTEATGQVVASAKNGMQMIEDIDTLDFSKLTLHQAKRQEMDSQVRVLELESELGKERVKLGELRKKHYQLAGESEGWDQEESNA